MSDDPTSPDYLPRPERGAERCRACGGWMDASTEQPCPWCGAELDSDRTAWEQE